MVIVNLHFLVLCFETSYDGMKDAQALKWGRETGSKHTMASNGICKVLFLKIK